MNNRVIIEQWLLEKHIKVNREWLEACLEWLLQQLPNPAVQDLKNAVYKQWITEDLCEMGCQSLPANITNIRKIMLTGKYILQINSLRDISQPAYHQLLKIKNDTGQDNIHVSAAPKEPEPAWKTQPKRMLYLEVTDGTAELHAMEYKPITQLNLNTRPGTKILVSGPVEYRMGVLFLTSKNIQVLGGHVEALVATNTQDLVLNRALGDTNRGLEAPVQRSSNLNTRLQTRDAPTVTRNNASLVSHHEAPAHRNLANESRGRERSTRSDYSVQERSDNTTGQKRSFSSTVEDDSSDEAFFDDVDVDVLIRASQAEEERVFAVPQQPSTHQVAPRVETDLDDFDFISDERMFEEEMENLLTSVDDHSEQESSRHTIVPNTASKQINWKSPYGYLSSVDMSCLPADHSKAEHIIIKGFVSTVTSQLKPHPKLGWQLRAKVNDGTLSLEVDLSDNLLTELIGLTVKEALKIKTQAHLNPQLNERIMKSVDQCQKSLQNMNGLLELVLVAPRPCLLKHIPFDTDRMKLLANRAAHL